MGKAEMLGVVQRYKDRLQHLVLSGMGRPRRIWVSCTTCRYIGIVVPKGTVECDSRLCRLCSQQSGKRRIKMIVDVRDWEHKELTAEQIDEMAEGADQGTFVCRLYSYALGDLWDKAVQIDGHPRVSPDTWKYICDAAIKIDKEQHPGVLAGGMWLNLGFTTGDMPDWEIGFETVEKIKVGEEGQAG